MIHTPTHRPYRPGLVDVHPSPVPDLLKVAALVPLSFVFGLFLGWLLLVVLVP